jgi:predicted TIM-barrel fold metal-dependent hydrolase
MYTKPDHPSHAEIIAARDRMLARHPRLRVIGAHLGSLEYDVAEIAARLDAYPNFAVDTSARMKDLAVQDPATVGQFLTAYAGRVLFGTDIVSREPLSEMSEEEQAAKAARFEEVYRREFAYYEGLGLPADALDQLYFKSAAAWYPGVL